MHKFQLHGSTHVWLVSQYTRILDSDFPYNKNNEIRYFCLCTWKINFEIFTTKLCRSLYQKCDRIEVKTTLFCPIRYRDCLKNFLLSHRQKLNHRKALSRLEISGHPTPKTSPSVRFALKNYIFSVVLTLILLGTSSENFWFTRWTTRLTEFTLCQIPLFGNSVIPLVLPDNQKFDNV